MRHIIITSSDENNGYFLINHWLRSLKINSDLKNIDIAVIDYGLNSEQRKKLLNEKVTIINGLTKGNICITRFIDAARFLQSKEYDQVLSVDGGDIIFQGDISQLFNTNKDFFRAVGHDLQNLFLESFIKGKFENKVERKIWKALKNLPIEKTVNAGFILAPKDKFLILCKKINELIINKNSYGPDQIVLNYIVHLDKLYFLDKKYNFMVANKTKFVVRNGIIYDADLNKAIVVHNPGHLNTRVIKDFGYGDKYNNKINYPIFFLRKFLYTYITPVLKQIFIAF